MRASAPCKNDCQHARHPNCYKQCVHKSFLYVHIHAFLDGNKRLRPSATLLDKDKFWFAECRAEMTEGRKTQTNNENEEQGVARIEEHDASNSKC